MLWDVTEVQETLRMVEAENLDIRTITMGISLRDAASENTAQLCERVREKILRCAQHLVSVKKDVENRFGIPIVNTRVSVTPIAIVAEGTRSPDFLHVAHTLEDVAAEVGVDYIAGFFALVEKGFTPGDEALFQSIAGAIASTKRVCSSTNVATTRAGINMDAVARLGHIIKQIAERSAAQGGIGCARFVVFANAVEDNPFIAGAFHGVGETDCVVNIGISGPGVILGAIERLKKMEERLDFGKLAEAIKRMAFKITRAGEIIGREVAARVGPPAQFGIVDLSLAPTPAKGDSVANIIEAMGIERAGAPGSTAALALLTDAVKKGGVMASSYVGGLSGSFIPVSEDSGMVEAVAAGAMSLEKLEAMTSVCSVGLDMVAVPGDTSAETISAIIADEVAIGVVNNKTTAVRIIPVPGRKAGDRVEFGGLLGEAIVMPVSRFSSSAFIRLGGRIPPPITGLRN